MRIVKLKETTKTWNADYHVPNHTYLMEGARAVGYIKEGESEPIFFKKGFLLDKKGRTFKVIND